MNDSNSDLKNKYKEQLLAEKKTRVRINRKIEGVEMEVDELSELLDEEGSQQKHGGKNKIIKVRNLAQNKRLIEEKKKREREMLKKALANGVDFLGDNNIKFETKKVMSLCARLEKGIIKVFTKLTPLKHDLRYVQNAYDKSIFGFFSIFRFLYTFSLITMLLYSVVLIKHLNYMGVNSIKDICSGFYPCDLLYT
jgi:hypothetical protein